MHHLVGSSAGDVKAPRQAVIGEAGASVDTFSDTRRTDRVAVCAWAVCLGALWLRYCGPSAANVVPFMLGLAVAAPVLGLADESCRDWVRRRLPDSWWGGVLIWAVLVALVLAAAASRQRTNPAFLLRWALYLALPIAILGKRWRTSVGVPLVLAAIALVIPFAVGMVPAVRLAISGQPPVRIVVPLVLDLGLLLLLVYRPQPAPQYRLWWPRRELLLATAAFAAFAVLALPAALALGFVRPGLGESTIGAAGLRLLQIFFLIAIPEELVFRGLLQNGVERLLGNARGLILATVLFGLSHIGHAPAPNWRYVVLATVAGVAYGWVYRKTRSITASAVTHTLVDWTWFVFLAGAVGQYAPG